MSFIRKWNEQKVQRAIKQLGEKPRYKAVYQCMHCGKTKECLVYEPNAIESLLVKGDGIWERYVLTCIVEIDEEEQHES